MGFLVRVGGGNTGVEGAGGGQQPQGFFAQSLLLDLT
jgi:hypothetical protein